MNEGTIWINRELAVASRLIARKQTGVSQADIVDEGHSKMVVIRYRYPIAIMKLFIAHELHRKVKLLQMDTTNAK